MDATLEPESRTSTFLFFSWTVSWYAAKRGAQRADICPTQQSTISRSLELVQVSEP